METFNDLDGGVCNFFRVLRDEPEELIRRIRLTPWARAEYDMSFIATDDPLEAARRFYAGSWMSISNATNHTASTYGWRCQSQVLDNRIANDIDRKYSDDLYTIAERFRYVQIENRPAFDVIAKYNHPDALIYFDPPYVEELRTKNDWYGHDWNGGDLHIEAATLLRNCAGYVVVSGYACPLYAELYEAHGWQRVDKEAQTNSGGKRIESLWLSPRTVAALDAPRQLSMFAA